MVRKRIGIEVSSICGLPSGRPFMIATAEPIMHPHQCSWCASIVYVPGPMFSCKACSGNSCAGRLCTKNTSWALIERPYSCAPQAVGAVYDRPGFLCKAVRRGVAALQFVHIRHFLFKTSTRRKAEKSKVLTVLRRYTRCRSE